jgi:DNA-binding CsgD family transcriptional regulator
MKRKRRGSFAKERKIRWERIPLGKEPDSDIADRLGCHRSTVRDARVKLGIATYVDPSRARRRSTAAKLRRAGRSLSQIAVELGVSRQRAYQLVEDIPLKTRRKGSPYSRTGSRRRGARKKR